MQAGIPGYLITLKDSTRGSQNCRNSGKVHRGFRLSDIDLHVRCFFSLWNSVVKRLCVRYPKSLFGGWIMNPQYLHGRALFILSAVTVCSLWHFGHFLFRRCSIPNIAPNKGFTVPLLLLSYSMKKPLPALQVAARPSIVKSSRATTHWTSLWNLLLRLVTVSSIYNLKTRSQSFSQTRHICDNNPYWWSSWCRFPHTICYASYWFFSENSYLITM
jgi:hypothetical protein